MGRFIAALRFVLLGAVFGCLAVAALVVAFGLVRIATLVADLVGGGVASGAAGKGLLLAAIEIVDLFLVGTVAYITGVGLYTLFVGGDVPLPVRLGVESLDDLKQKIIGVLVVALGVLALGQAAVWDGSAGLAYFGVGVAAVIVALAFFLRQKSG